MPDLFRGIVNREAKDSTPWWPEPNRLDKNLPNIVTALLDDTGCAQSVRGKSARSFIGRLS